MTHWSHHEFIDCPPTPEEEELDTLFELLEDTVDEVGKDNAHLHHIIRYYHREIEKLTDVPF